jgi:cyclophilin family peptidyl-prolyl cis-trans isomerase
MQRRIQMKRLPFLIFVAACALAQTPATPPAGQPAAPAREPGLYATITTSMGPITVRLFEKEAPVTVRNFVQLARGTKAWRDPKTGQMVRRPLYPSTIFHRVIPGFMVQVGDPTGTGAGDVGFTIPDEFSPNLKFDVPGRLGMANAGPKTGGSQFFITEVPTPHLNGAHTIFGQVVEGQDLVGKIARVPRNADDKPRTPVRIVSITFQREGPAPPNAPEGVARPATKKAAPAAKKAAPATKKATPPALQESCPAVDKEVCAAGEEVAGQD